MNRLAASAASLLLASIVLGADRMNVTVQRLLSDECLDSEIHLVSSISSVPSAVWKLVTSLCNDCEIADFDARWNPTDVYGASDKLPFRRVAAAGQCGDNWFVHYEHGGRGFHSHFVFAEFENAKARFLLGGSFSGFEPNDQLQNCDVKENDACEW